MHMERLTRKGADTSSQLIKAQNLYNAVKYKLFVFIWVIFLCTFHCIFQSRPNMKWGPLDGGCEQTHLRKKMQWRVRSTFSGCFTSETTFLRILMGKAWTSVKIKTTDIPVTSSFFNSFFHVSRLCSILFPFPSVCLGDKEGFSCDMPHFDNESNSSLSAKWSINGIPQSVSNSLRKTWNPKETRQNKSCRLCLFVPWSPCPIHPGSVFSHQHR